jgi:hypothetical protein
MRATITYKMVTKRKPKPEMTTRDATGETTRDATTKQEMKTR